MSFDVISGIYDRLAKLVFGREWLEVQNAPIQYLTKARHVLIVGGGSGQFLEVLSGHVTYVELSDKMIDLAKGRNANCDVDFVHADFLCWTTDQRFDAIVFPFFMDCFCESHLKKIIIESGNLLKPNGQIIVLDFQKATRLKNVLVKMMYIFFRLVSGLEARQLQDFKNHFENAGYQETARKEFIGGWVFCGNYSRLKQD